MDTSHPAVQFRHSSGQLQRHAVWEPGCSVHETQVVRVFVSLQGDDLSSPPDGYTAVKRLFPCVIHRDGDHYDALRDCLKALTLNPGHLKAHFRLARCLFELKYVAEALECLDDFKGKFPEQAHSSACDALDKDIKAALFSKTESGRKGLHGYLHQEEQTVYFSVCLKVSAVVRMFFFS